MLLFGKSKGEETPYNENAKYKVLGVGCKKCTKLYNNLQELKKAGVIEGDITKVSDPSVIGSYGVMRTPCLVVDEELIIEGDSPSISKLEKLLS